MSLAQPGDILLCQGLGETSEAIRVLDGGVYSHAAIWSGDAVIESTTPEVVEWPLEESLRAHPRSIVDVYRSAVPALGADVVRAARRYVGRRYSFGDLFLGAVITVSTGAFPSEKQLSFLNFGSRFNAFLALDDEEPDELVTCVELVVRAYFQCGARIRIDPCCAGHLDVDVLLAGIARFAIDGKGDLPDSASVGDAWLHLRRSYARKLALMLARRPCEAPTIAPAVPVRLSSEHEPHLRAAGFEWAANLVTPRHLATSPDLTFQGRLYEASPAARKPA